VKLTATLFAQPEIDRGTPWLLVADHGRDVAAGLFRVPDFVWEKMPFARIAKLCIAVGIGAFVDHVSLRILLTVSVILLYQCEDNEPFVLLLGKQILTGRQAVREFRQEPSCTLSVDAKSSPPLLPVAYGLLCHVPSVR
jgi:hypothetical protein